MRRERRGGREVEKRGGNRGGRDEEREEEGGDRDGVGVRV
jgi:hypothetical protein